MGATDTSEAHGRLSPIFRAMLIVNQLAVGLILRHFMIELYCTMSMLHVQNICLQTALKFESEQRKAFRAEHARLKQMSAKTGPSHFCVNSVMFD